MCYRTELHLQSFFIKLSNLTFNFDSTSTKTKGSRWRYTAAIQPGKSFSQCSDLKRTLMAKWTQATFELITFHNKPVTVIHCCKAAYSISRIRYMVSKGITTIVITPLSLKVFKEHGIKGYNNYIENAPLSVSFSSFGKHILADSICWSKTWILKENHWWFSSEERHKFLIMY